MLGMRHATDPDHIVAVTTIVSRERSVVKAAGIGAVWGIGHTVTLLLVGGAIIAFKVAFNARLGLSLELSVAIMLIVLGLLNIFDVRASTRRISASRPFVVGIVHGLAGSAGAALLIVPLIDDPRWAALYLLTFGLGTIVGMAFITLTIALPSLLATAHLPSLQRSLRIASGAVSLVFGLYLAHKIGFTDGLFTSDPRWTPR
ncbi:MAG: high-affinity nickel-transport family protein [Gemmatimonadetes bacterium]|nr:MAG: high-affinity nickel-transport family protein [Gemmatimonadota bacterium]